jgi:sulfur relay (sulfurtransferase) DsrC/TusE family protein
MSESISVSLDADGFMTDPSQWNEAVAQEIADALGIGPLEDSHRKIIGYIRDHCIEHHALCAMETICHYFEADKDCVRKLFKGPVEAWKVSGMVNPGVEALTYMQNEE